MKSKSIILVMFSLLTGYSSFGQIVHCTIHGTIQPDAQFMESVEKSTVMLISEISGDTMTTVHPTENAEFNFKIDLQVDSIYSLVTESRGFAKSVVSFNVPDTIEFRNYHFEIELIAKTDRHRFKLPHFEHNEIEFSDFNIEDLQDLVNGFPGICLQFSHSRNSSEYLDIGPLRIKAFQKYLIENDFDMSSVSFSYEDQTVVPPEGIDGSRLTCEEYDCRGRIEGIVISMEDGCK